LGLVGLKVFDMGFRVTGIRKCGSGFQVKVFGFGMKG
jgi:hypothetical protein